MLWEIRHNHLNLFVISLSGERELFEFLLSRKKPFQSTSLITSLFRLKRMDEQTIYVIIKIAFSIIDQSVI